MPDSSAVTFLAVHSGEFEWAVEASKVVRVVRAADWTETTPMNLFALLGVAAQHLESARVLLVESADGQVALSVPGAVRLRSHARSQVLALPAILFSSARAREWLRAIVVTEGEPPMFVLDPDALGNPNPSQETSRAEKS